MTEKREIKALQDAHAQQIVNDAVLVCLTGMVGDLIEAGQLDYREDFETAQPMAFNELAEGWPLEAWQHVAESSSGDSYYDSLAKRLEDEGGAPDIYEDAEVLEWWAVNYWLRDELRERGEVTGYNYGLYIWGRQESGQAIYLDGVIQELALERLKSQGEVTQEQRRALFEKETPPATGSAKLDSCLSADSFLYRYDIDDEDGYVAITHREDGRTYYMIFEFDADEVFNCDVYTYVDAFTDRIRKIAELRRWKSIRHEWLHMFLSDPAHPSLGK